MLHYYGYNNTDHRDGIKILLNEELYKVINNFVPFSDRCLLTQLVGSLFNMNIIQIYAPTSDRPRPEQELGKWYKNGRI